MQVCARGPLMYIARANRLRVSDSKPLNDLNFCLNQYRCLSIYKTSNTTNNYIRYQNHSFEILFSSNYQYARQYL